MNTKLLAAILLFILLGSIVYVLMATKTQPTSSPPSSIIENTPSVVAPTSALTNELRAGGSSYRDPSNLFVFLYPNDYKLDTQDPQHIRIYKNGATQKGQTEMYDGVIMVFEPITLERQTIEQLVDSRIQQVTADGMSEITVPKTPVTINSYKGFSYSARGLGEADNIVLQKDAASTYAVMITVFAPDPENIGYQKEVEAVLSTLELFQ